ncbi:alpha/beta hydrolase [Flaviaesturariibacter amylovorans]|uniref:Alpha/beta hydrolase n=1 Tax=Flaviaesturariibacter amylovorans TaxID=1084520 RepID=A0ABP8HNR2_9BACT
MKSILALFLLATSSLSLQAQEQRPIWPAGKMPNTRGLVMRDSIVDGYAYLLKEPRLGIYPAPKEKNTGTAVLIIPGGGYARTQFDPDKIGLAKYFQSVGINAFVVWYRLPASADLLQPELAPLQDIQRAMRMIRAGAKEWGIDTARVGVFGTSAGGHGATTLATHTADLSAIGDAADPYSYKPAFTILLSPVISFRDDIAHKGSRTRLLGKQPPAELIAAYSNETRVTRETPPALLLHAQDDKSVSPANSIVYYEALHKAGVPASLHIFPSGGHRLSIEYHPGSAALWPALMLEWLRELKFLP